MEDVRVIRILAVLMLLSSPAMAQVTNGPLPGTSNTMITDSEGKGCLCIHDGKSWPCRKAVDFTKAISCNAVGIAELICPENKNELCTYDLKNTCPPSLTIPVCWAADEPK
jgi:hypothetical protein